MIARRFFFSYMRLDDRIPADYPLRAVRQLVDLALAELSRAIAKLYARDGRPSIPPERLLRALLLQAFHTVRSERQLMEQLDYNLLFRWFVGLSADDPGVGCDRVLQETGSNAKSTGYLAALPGCVPNHVSRPGATL
jgi:transposase